MFNLQLTIFLIIWLAVRCQTQDDDCYVTYAGCRCLDNWSYMGKDGLSGCANPDNDTVGSWCLVSDEPCAAGKPLNTLPAANSAPFDYCSKKCQMVTEDDYVGRSLADSFFSILESEKKESAILIGNNNDDRLIVQSNNNRLPWNSGGLLSTPAPVPSPSPPPPTDTPSSVDNFGLLFANDYYYYDQESTPSSTSSGLNFMDFFLEFSPLNTPASTSTPTPTLTTPETTTTPNDQYEYYYDDQYEYYYDDQYDNSASNFQPQATASGSFVSDYESAHNSRRARHCVASMSWDASIAASAQAYAEQCVFEHSNAQGLGENLFLGKGVHYSAEDVVGMWYDEITLYSYKNPGFSAATGHFTQRPTMDRNGSQQQDRMRLHLSGFRHGTTWNSAFHTLQKYGSVQEFFLANSKKGGRRYGFITVANNLGQWLLSLGAIAVDNAIVFISHALPRNQSKYQEKSTERSQHTENDSYKATQIHLQPDKEQRNTDANYTKDNFQQTSNPINREGIKANARTQKKPPLTKQSEQQCGINLDEDTLNKSNVFTTQDSASVSSWCPSSSQVPHNFQFSAGAPPYQPVHVGNFTSKTKTEQKQSSTTTTTTTAQEKPASLSRKALDFDSFRDFRAKQVLSLSGLEKLPQVCFLNKPFPGFVAFEEDVFPFPPGQLITQFDEEETMALLEYLKEIHVIAQDQDWDVVDVLQFSLLGDPTIQQLFDWFTSRDVPLKSVSLLVDNKWKEVEECDYTQRLSVLEFGPTVEAEVPREVYLQLGWDRFQPLARTFVVYVDVVRRFTYNAEILSGMYKHRHENVEQINPSPSDLSDENVSNCDDDLVCF